MRVFLINKNSRGSQGAKKNIVDPSQANYVI